MQNKDKHPDLNKKVHDARTPLNQISMQAELIKILIESNGSAEKLTEAAQKIIDNCQKCSHSLQQISEALRQ
ncbi:histidine kinase dimerization/phospho-acceptor domain-containing protein [Catenovulum sediminis]|uniref:histidine kinase n=1 Tax=Catenovulum sediminis TaxID=1740262 RepID=A0ABV1RJB6_9ALTE|nr:histidine kinase dimerization/phospho-acceptor domain-containing protein [Catenovulum sediminis]